MKRLLLVVLLSASGCSWIASHLWQPSCGANPCRKACGCTGCYPGDPLPEECKP